MDEGRYKQNDSEEDYLTLQDFYDADHTDRPEIMIHVIKTLTGVNISTQTYRIDEEPEHKQFKVQPALFHSCESLSDFYRLPRDVSRNIYNCYMTLWGRFS